MISLFIDTSSSDVSIALFKNDNPMKIIREEIINKHSVYVLDCIDNMLKEYNIGPKEINKIYVVNGPGSFTGTRIGVTIAKTISYLNNIKVCLISSLKDRIIGLTSDDYYLSLIDNKNDNYFYGLYDRNYNTIIENRDNISKIKEIITKYHPKIIADKETMLGDEKIDKRDLDVINIFKYYQDKEAVYHDDVMVNYLKNPAGIEDK